MLKVFKHQFSNGSVIELTFDMSKPMPYCESNMRMDKQPVEILQEFRIWQETVVLPVIMNCATPEQIREFVRYGRKKMMENKN